jgi:hypothetical protein
VDWQIKANQLHTCEVTAPPGTSVRQPLIVLSDNRVKFIFA